MSDDSSGQLQGAKPEIDPIPSHLWKTALGRSLFGFFVETRENPYFLNDDYLQRLCDTENNVATGFGKLSLYSIGFSLFAITTANQALGESSYFGIRIASIPYLTEFCTLILGAMVSLMIILILETITLSRMRLILFSITGSETPNMRMVHMKGNNAWVDALVPKTIGYSSSWFHKLIQTIGLIWALSIPMSLLAILVAAQAICYISLRQLELDWLSEALLALGVGISVTSVAIAILVSMVPLKFKLKGVDAEAQQRE